MSLTGFNRRRRRREQAAKSIETPIIEESQVEAEDMVKEAESPVEDILIDETPTEVIPTIDELKTFAESNNISLGLTFTVDGALKKIKKAGLEYKPET